MISNILTYLLVVPTIQILIFEENAIAANYLWVITFVSKRNDHSPETAKFWCNLISNYN